MSARLRTFVQPEHTHDGRRQIRGNIKMTGSSAEGPFRRLENTELSSKRLADIADGTRQQNRAPRQVGIDNSQIVLRCELLDAQSIGRIGAKTLRKLLAAHVLMAVLWDLAAAAPQNDSYADGVIGIWRADYRGIWNLSTLASGDRYSFVCHKSTSISTRTRSYRLE